MVLAAIGDENLLKLQRDTFGYFLHNTNPANGMVLDNTHKGSYASIAAIGLGLAAYPVGVERGFLSREEAIARTLTTLRFFWHSPQGRQPNAIGYKGFYYHFLDMKTGRRIWKCELSPLDTTFLIAGALATATYFDGEAQDEREIRSLTDALYRRVDWKWALNRGLTVSMGWKPERGFSPYRYEGYNEALLLYILGLASPTHPLPPESYTAFTSTYRWERLYDQEFVYAGPLFIHQFSHLWIDFRGLQDAFMRQKGIDYFENSRRATYVQRQYAIDNPLGFQGYGKTCWGISASDGPGPKLRRIDGVKRRFFDYEARGVPYGPDDGTIAAWSVVASLPFAPEIVLPTLQHFEETYPDLRGVYGFKCSFNPTFRERGRTERGWISPGYYGINQGPKILMIENWRTGFFWRLMRQCSYLDIGLRRTGFRGD